MAYTTIKKPSDYFNTKLYTGNANASSGTTQSITNVGFQPDMVWIKSRSATTGHTVWDNIRGVTNWLTPNNTNAEGTYSGGLTSFDSDGFTVGDGGDINRNGNTQVAWNWLASNTTASNTDGSITSTVSANTTSGFSIVSYTGNGSSSATVGHGLGVIPKMVICKERNNADNWHVRHESLSSNYNLWLNATDRAYNMTNEVNNGGIADLSSSSTFGFVQGVQDVNSVNQSGSTYIAYCFSEVKGFSKFGSYTGNGSADGTFCFTGFKPAFVMIKNTSSTGTWMIKDTKRDLFNVANTALGASNPAPEVDYSSSLNEIDILSNGFKLRDTYSDQNTSGNNYIYMAFAEEPLVGDNPATAR